MNHLHFQTDTYRKFRHYSRAVLRAPSVAHYHKERISIAKRFTESEPLQGALSDYLFGCWYDIPTTTPEYFADLEPLLNAESWQIINACLDKRLYLQKTNPLATRWSVITTPTLDVPRHKLRISTDDATQVSNLISEALLNAKKSNNLNEIKDLEDDFFNHCLACHDMVAFMKTWFKLGKHDWVFDMRWVACRTELERLNISKR